MHAREPPPKSTFPCKPPTRFALDLAVSYAHHGHGHCFTSASLAYLNPPGCSLVPFKHPLSLASTHCACGAPVTCLSLRPPLLEFEHLGEACVPVALSQILLLLLVPFITLSKSPNLILGCFHRSGLISKFGFCRPKHPSFVPSSGECSSPQLLAR